MSDLALQAKTYPRSSRMAIHYWPNKDRTLFPLVMCGLPVLVVTAERGTVTCRTCLRLIAKHYGNSPAPRVVARSLEAPF